MAHRIHQEIVFDATPDRIYGMLTDSTQFSRMCGGAPTEIDAISGGPFSCFGGMILGRNVECVPGERIVQAWRVKSWTPGTFSIARFELRPEGTKTRVVLDHTGFPEEQGEHLDQGWHANYWEPMRKSLS